MEKRTGSKNVLVGVFLKIFNSEIFKNPVVRKTAKRLFTSLCGSDMVRHHIYDTYLYAKEFAKLRSCWEANVVDGGFEPSSKEGKSSSTRPTKRRKLNNGQSQSSSGYSR